MPRIDALQVAHHPAGKPLTPPQKRFNTLLRKIAQGREALVAWHENLAAYQQAHADVLKPLQDELIAGRRAWVFALDAALERHGWSKTDADTLRQILCAAAGEWLEARGADEPLKSLFDKHAEVDFDTEQREKRRVMKELAEAMTGVDLGDDEGIDDDAALFERLQHGLDEQAAAAQARRDAKVGRRRTSAAQQRREAEAEQATQSVREVFRKLASALHPDREPDERQREAKTALMQRVNQAYQANDLLALLEIQLQIEQIDASHLANASEQRLKHYNKVLGDQLAELKLELEHVEMEFRRAFGLEPGLGLDPRKLGRVLEQTRLQWQAALHEQQGDLHMLGDVAATRRWLKHQRQLRREAASDFLRF